MSNGAPPTTKQSSMLLKKLLAHFKLVRKWRILGFSLAAILAAVGGLAAFGGNAATFVSGLFDILSKRHEESAATKKIDLAAYRLGMMVANIGWQQFCSRNNIPHDPPGTENEFKAQAKGYTSALGVTIEFSNLTLFPEPHVRHWDYRNPNGLAFPSDLIKLQRGERARNLFELGYRLQAWWWLASKKDLRKSEVNENGTKALNAEVLLSAKDLGFSKPAEAAEEILAKDFKKEILTDDDVNSDYEGELSDLRQKIDEALE